MAQLLPSSDAWPKQMPSGDSPDAPTVALTTTTATTANLTAQARTASTSQATANTRTTSSRLQAAGTRTTNTNSSSTGLGTSSAGTSGQTDERQGSKASNSSSRASSSASSRARSAASSGRTAIHRLRRWMSKESVHKGFLDILFGTDAASDMSLSGSAPLIDERIRQLLTFEGCEDLLRGMDLNRMISKGASIFADNSGSAATYKLSSVRPWLDAFISHNWSVPRWRKYLCLVFHFNTWIGLGVASLVSFVLFVAGLQGHLPTNEYISAEFPKTWVFSAFCVPTYLLTTFFVRDVAQYFCKGQAVFLDKTCIHQEDRAIQAQGIQKLGAFLRFSDRMVVCYSDVYMKKLWTVYEVASFLTLHPIHRMDVIPTMLPIMLLLLLVLFWAISILSHIVELSFNTVGLTWYLNMMILVVFIPIGARYWERKKVQIQTDLSTFEINNAVVFCEDDRPIIYGNIAALMKKIDRVDLEATDEEALQSFETLVRATLPYALIESIGPTGLHYHQIMVLSTASTLTQFLDFSAGVGVPNGLPLRHLLTYFLWYFNGLFVLGPMALLGTMHLMSRCRNLKGLPDLLYMFLVPFIFVTGPFWAIKVFGDWLEVVARDSMPILICWIITSFLAASVVLVVLTRATSGPSTAQLALQRTLSEKVSVRPTNRSGAGDTGCQVRTLSEGFREEYPEQGGEEGGEQGEEEKEGSDGEGEDVGFNGELDSETSSTLISI